MQELLAVFREMGETPTTDELTDTFAAFDIDKSGAIDYHEFVLGVVKYILNNRDVRHGHVEHKRSRSHSGASAAEARHMLKGGEDEEEEEDVPEDIKDLSPEEQQSRIKFRSCMMMGVGTLIVLIVSDPMVEVMSELGKRTGIPAFYIAFVLAPLASNASELIAAYNYSMKKTSTSMSISLSTLEGAAVMNNTFVLGKCHIAHAMCTAPTVLMLIVLWIGIFMLLICTQSLVWEFFAETLSILFVQVMMALVAMKKTHTVLDGFLILSLYPLSLALVAGLEAIGWN
jgi:Ca2+/H+ antiporter